MFKNYVRKLDLNFTYALIYKQIKHLILKNYWRK